VISLADARALIVESFLLNRVSMVMMQRIRQVKYRLCVVDGKGKKMCQGKCQTKPEETTRTIRDKALCATLVGLESKAL